MNESHSLAILGGLTFRQAVWLFPLAFVLHVIEEWPHFVAWAIATHRRTLREESMW